MNSTGREKKKRKRATRSNFTQRKNGESLRQPKRPKTFLQLKLKLPTSIPSHWMVFSSDDLVQVSKVSQSPVGMFEISSAVQISSDLSFKVFVNGKTVPVECSVLQEVLVLLNRELSPFLVNQLLREIDNATICVGNPDERYVHVCKEKEDVIKGERGVGEAVAFLDNYPTKDSAGTTYACTVRRVDCHLLCTKKSSQCLPCQSFRSTLRSCCSRQKSRLDSSESMTATSSHTKYSTLTSAQKDQRLKNLHESLKVANKAIARLEKKLRETIDTGGVDLSPEDSTDMSLIFNNLNKQVKGDFAEDSPQWLLWNEQKKYHQLKDKRQMRWHPLIIRFALNLKYLSTSAYRAVSKSGMLSLPSERILSDYTHWTQSHSGVQLEFIEELKLSLEKEIPSKNHHVAVSLDEMKIRSGLVFSKHSGCLVGFVDLGRVNEDIESLLTEEDKPKELASHMLVFMARAVFKPTLFVPIAHYFSFNLSGEKIFPLAWDVIEALELYNIPVVSVTSDGAKPNRRFYRLCQGKSKLPVPYKTLNPFRNDATLHFFCDPPHLLKTARNCFSNSFAHSKSRKMKKKGQEISWKWIESLFLTETKTTDPGVRLCFKLTREHIWLNSFTRMRVHLASQVMSETVACALEFLHPEKTQQTRLFIRMINRFFDHMNVRTKKLSTFKRNEHIAPYTSIKDERFKWLVEVFLAYLDEWEAEAQDCLDLKPKERQKLYLSKETMDGLRITVKSFTEVGPQMLKLPGVEYLLSEVFSQDPLERYFSRQRHRGGSNDNPTAIQALHTSLTLFQQQSIYKDLKSLNPSSAVDDTISQQPLRKRARKCEI